MQSQRLRIESFHGSPVNDYRIRDGQVEMRLLDAAGHVLRPPLSDWKALDGSDIELHFALETVVAKWLEARVDEEESGVLELRTQHTGERIPASGIYRVYHRAHRLPDEVALREGFPFPRCAKCSGKVRFRMMSAAAGDVAEQHGIVLHELPEMPESEAA